jgi:hypothetical protein
MSRREHRVNPRSVHGAGGRVSKICRPWSARECRCAGSQTSRQCGTEELARIQAEKAARAEAARKAAAAPPPKALPPKALEPEPATPPRPAAPRPAPVGGRPLHKEPTPLRDTGDRRDRSLKASAPAAPDVWAEVSEPVQPSAPARPAAASRVRRGDDKPARRRVIIDSQAGRKGGKGGPRDRREPVRAAGGPLPRATGRTN